MNTTVENSTTEITKIQHPNSIWTWKSNQRGGKVSIWLPYLSKVEKKKGSSWLFEYKGGELVADLNKVDCVMVYGASGSLPVALIDELKIRRIPLVIHRRNMVSPAVFLPGLRPDPNDLLTRQILFRENETKSVYISRQLIRARFRGVENTLSIADVQWRKLNRARNHVSLRALEAEWSKKYWKNYFSALGLAGTRRREKTPATNALNACSMFLTGILLRWTLAHRLSPCHGYLHVGTDYAGLVYDLMEPYRYLLETAVAEILQKEEMRTREEKDITGASIEQLKRLLEVIVYVPATRQYVRRKNLLHGVVLALRTYLAGDMKKFVPPVEGTKRGGRPVKVSYRLPGGTSINKMEMPPF